MSDDPRSVDDVLMVMVSVSGVVAMHTLMSLPVQNSRQHLYTLADAVSELDQILTAGGPLPSRWAKHWQRKAT